MTGRKHDRAAAPAAPIGLHEEAVVGAPHRGHRRLGLYGRADRVGVALDERDDLGHRHVAVGVVAFVPIVRQAALPVRREQRERIPPLGLPSVRQGATLEGDMDVQGILGIDSDVRNGFSNIKVTYNIDADASPEDIKALVAQSQKRSAVYDIITNPTNVTVEVV